MCYMVSPTNSKQLCPACKYPHCYIGLSTVECWNIACKFYSEKQHKILLERKKRNSAAPETTVVDHVIDNLYNYNSNNYYHVKPATTKDKVISKEIFDLIHDFLDQHQ